MFLQRQATSVADAFSAWQAVHAAALAAREGRCKLGEQRSDAKRLRSAATAWRECTAAAANLRAAAVAGCDVLALARPSQCDILCEVVRIYVCGICCAAHRAGGCAVASNVASLN